MGFDREAAKKAGYTDQEIDQFLAHQSQAPGANEPPPPSTQVPEVDTTNSMLATAAGGAATAAPYAAGAYGAAKLGSMIPHAVQALRGAVSPSAGATAGAVNPATAAKGSTTVAEMASKTAIKDIALQGLQRGAQGVAQAAGAVAPYVRGLAGAALMTHSRGLNEGEDELVRQMHAHQDQQFGGAIAPQGQR